MAIAKNTICLWYDKDTEAAARFYRGSADLVVVGRRRARRVEDGVGGADYSSAIHAAPL
jgi:hypothetical protein